MNGYSVGKLPDAWGAVGSGKGRGTKEELEVHLEGEGNLYREAPRVRGLTRKKPGLGED